MYVLNGSDRLNWYFKMNIFLGNKTSIIKPRLFLELKLFPQSTLEKDMDICCRTQHLMFQHNFIPLSRLIAQVKLSHKCTCPASLSELFCIWKPWKKSKARSSLPGKYHRDKSQWRCRCLLTVLTWHQCNPTSNISFQGLNTFLYAFKTQILLRMSPDRQLKCAKSLLSSSRNW